jgi:TolB-like protein/Flp pilus assembly protein TadD
MTTAQLAAAKRRTLVLAAAGAAVLLALLALLFAGVILGRRAHKGAAEAGGPKRVVVLPFENLGAAEDDYLADGVADAVRGKLASLPGLEVIARASSAAYKKAAKSPVQIARDLGVRYLLRATVRRQKGAGTASRVQISPELLEVSGSGAPVSKWKQPFDAEPAGVFQVQSDIARRVAQAVGVALGAREEKRLAGKPTQNVAAYDAFLRGEEASKRGLEDPPSLRRTLSFYDQAVALDPSFAQAWAQVSVTSSILYGNGTPEPEVGEHARNAAEKAIALAPDSPEGYVALGIQQVVVGHDDKHALELFAQGLRLAPPGTDLLRTTARVEQSLGRWEAAAEHFRLAERLDPRLTLIKKLLGSTLNYLRRYSEARQVLDRGLALAPTDLDLIEFKAMTFLAQGDLAGARAVLKATPREVTSAALVAYMANYGDLVWLLDEELRDLLLRLTPSAFDGDRGVWSLCLAEAYAIRGDSAGVRTHAEEARKALEEQLRAAPQDAQRHASLGLALAYLGQKEEAIREGEQAVSLQPVTKDAVEGPYNQHQLARIYMLVGEPEKALDQLEPLLKIPYWLSPAWLEIDPSFDPLRKNPRFQKLVATPK